MIIERSLLPDFLTNTYLVADREGGEAFLLDAGGPMGPLFERADALDVTPSHVLLTHHHYDHVKDLAEVRERYPGITVLIDGREPHDGLGEVATLPQHLTIGELEIENVHTPGHTAGMQNPLVAQAGETPVIFTGDTLFKSSIGGVRAPGSTSYADMRHSIMDVLMALAPETIVKPGHADPTTIGDEWEANGFVRVWRGLDPEGTEPCTALGEPATLILFGDDYDGGHKAWIRWPDGRDDIVPGSQVERG